MNKAAFDQKFGFFKMVLGVTRRLVEQFPEDHWSFKPSSGSRSTSEIISHMYTFLYTAMKSAKEGTFIEEKEPKLATKADVLKYMDEQVAKTYQVYATITDQDLNQKFDAWGTQFSGADFLNFIFDEHWHHRGQLTVYLRMSGVTPMLVYDYQG